MGSMAPAIPHGRTPVARRTPAAAGFGDPGRTPPDLRAAGHNGRPLRNRLGRTGDDREGWKTHPSEDHRFDRHGPAGREPDSGVVQSPTRRCLSPARTRQRNSFFARTHSTDESNARAIPRHRRPGPQPQGDHAAGIPGSPGGCTEGVPRSRWQKGRPQSRRSLHDAARLLQQPAGTGRGAAADRRRSPDPVDRPRNPQTDR